MTKSSSSITKFNNVHHTLSSSFSVLRSLWFNSYYSAGCWLLILSSSQIIQIAQSETLHGTTVLNWPYVNRMQNGQFEGFCIDVLNELAQSMGIAYTMKLASDGQYGGWLDKNGSVNGVIGDVMRGEADFAIGDITVLTTRDRFVDFTLPFMEFGLSALIRKDLINGEARHIRNFKDLSEQTAIPYGVKKIGANLPLFHTDPVVAKMYSYMDTHPSGFVSGEREGVKRVKRERYAFIAESPFVEYVVERDCTLAAIDDRRKHFQFEYAIAVPKGSPYKARFSKAIRQLKLSGRLRELKDKYWKSPRCTTTDGDFSSVGGRIRNNQYNQDEDINSSPVKFADRGRLRHDATNDAAGGGDSGGSAVRKNEPYRGPHDEVEEDEVELIRPRPAGRERRPLRPRKREPNGASPTTEITNKQLTHLMIYLCCLWLATTAVINHQLIN